MAGDIILWIIGLIIGIIIAVWLLNWLYHRTTKERAFVRTGMGGERVVSNSGTFVIPVIHEITPVSLNLARLGVVAQKEEALITADKMRVDVEAEFRPGGAGTGCRVFGGRNTWPDDNQP